MEEERRITRNKFIIISSVTFFLLISALIVFLLINNNDKKLENNLTKNGFKKTINKIYKKEENKNNSQVAYTYDINNKLFTKSEVKTTEDTKENINISTKNNIVKISYLYKDLNGCLITQEGTYKNNNFDCEVISKNKQSCNLKCDVMLKYIKNFNKELSKLK